MNKINGEIMFLYRKFLVFLTILSVFNLGASDRKNKRARAESPGTVLENTLMKVLPEVNPHQYINDTNALLLRLSKVIKRFKPLVIKRDDNSEYLIPSSVIQESEILKTMLENNSDTEMKESDIQYLHKDLIFIIDSLIQRKTVTDINFDQIINLIYLMDFLKINFEFLRNLECKNFVELIAYIKRENILLLPPLFKGLSKLYSVKKVDASDPLYPLNDFLNGNFNDSVMARGDVLVFAKKTVQGGQVSQIKDITLHFVPLTKTNISPFRVLIPCANQSKDASLIDVQKYSDTIYHVLIKLQNAAGVETYYVLEVDLNTHNYKKIFGVSAKIVFIGSPKCATFGKDCVSIRDMATQKENKRIFGPNSSDYSHLFSDENHILASCVYNIDNSIKIINCNIHTGQVSSVDTSYPNPIGQRQPIFSLSDEKLEIIKSNGNTLIGKVTSKDTNKKYCKLVKIDLTQNKTFLLYNYNYVSDINENNCALSDEYFLFRDHSEKRTSLIKINLTTNLPCAVRLAPWPIMPFNDQFCVLHSTSNLTKYQMNSRDDNTIIITNELVGEQRCLSRLNDSYLVSFRSAPSLQSLNFTNINCDEIINVLNREWVGIGSSDKMELVHNQNTNDYYLLFKSGIQAGRVLKITDVMPLLDLIQSYANSNSSSSCASSSSATTSNPQPVASSSADAQN